MKEQMRIELHNETEYTERISFQDVWTRTKELKYDGCRVAAITDRNSVNGIHMAEHYFQREGIQPIYGVTLNCIDVDDRYDVVLLAANLTGRDNISLDRTAGEQPVFVWACRYQRTAGCPSQGNPSGGGCKERSDRSCHSASAGSKVSGDDHARLRLSGIYQ